MKIKLTLFSLVIASLCGWFNIANSQVPLLEKTYDVSGKAKRGFLGGVEIDKEKESLSAYYLESSFFAGGGNTKWGGDLPCEVYIYDKELNLTSNSKIDVRPGTYEWANFRGFYTYEVVRAQFSLGGLSFQKIDREYVYDPKTGEYRVNREKVSDKEKPQQGNGNKYSFIGGAQIYDVIAEGTSLAISGKKVPKTAETKKNYMHIFNQLMHYDVLRCDKNLNITVTDSLDFEFASSVIYSGQLQDKRIEPNDDLARDWILIYIAGWQPKDGFLYQAPNPTYCTYVRINPQGKIVEKFNFDSPANFWRIGGVYEENNSVYIYGSAINKDREKKNRQGIGGSKSPDILTYTHFQIGKVSNGKFDFLVCPSFADMQAKMKKPAGQKKNLELTGESEIPTAITITSTGDIYIGYQNYNLVEIGKVTLTSSSEAGTRAFKNMFMFQFDSSGNNKMNYGIELAESPEKEGTMGKPAKNYFIPSGDGKSLYWFLSYPKDAACTTSKVDENMGGNIYGKHCWSLLGVDYMSIDIETGEVSEKKSIGEDKKNPFYMYETTKPYQIGNYVYLFCENENDKGKGGDTMKLTRFDISK